MKFGFDLDGTLDHPAVVALANALCNDIEAGHEVHVITVGRLNCAGYETTREAKIEKLNRLGVSYHYLVLVGGDTFEEAGRRKAEYIQDHELDLMIDDSSTFVKEIALGTDVPVLHLKQRSTYAR